MTKSEQINWFLLGHGHCSDNAGEVVHLDPIKTRVLTLELPTELSKSIELKTKAEQDAQRMEFILQKERQEADRKSIEAEGIAAFQRIVSEGISPNLLMWKGIEATEKLAESSNSKIVMMGNNGQSLPVLLSADHPTSESSVGEAAPTPQAGQQSMSKASKVTSSPIAGEPAASPGQ